MNRTKGQIEAEVCEDIIKFEKDHMGRGPLETKAYLVDDLIVVRLRGVLTRAEHQLAGMGGDSVGRSLIKQVRIALLENGRPMLEKSVESITGQAVRSLHTDISTVTGERIIVFSLDAPPKLPTG